MIFGSALVAMVVGASVEPPLVRAGGISQDDYPAAALAARAEGTAVVRLLVAPSGRVSDCAVARTSGRADLDAASCTLLTRRYRFAPARDSSGKPVSQWLTHGVAWTLPAAIPLAPGKKPAAG
jgi:protein TonB